MATVTTVVPAYVVHVPDSVVPLTELVIKSYMYECAAPQLFDDVTVTPIEACMMCGSLAATELRYYASEPHVVIYVRPSAAQDCSHIDSVAGHQQLQVVCVPDLGVEPEAVSEFAMTFAIGLGSCFVKYIT